jgi:hypothetical protein
MATVYIHYVFFLSLQLNSRKITLCCLMLKVANVGGVGGGGVVVGGGATIGVIVAPRGSLCCYTSTN